MFNNSENGPGATYVDSFGKTYTEDSAKKLREDLEEQKKKFETIESIIILLIG